MKRSGGTPGARHTIAEALEELSRCAIRFAPSRELSLSALGTLATLASSGPIPTTELAARERISQPSMTTLVSRLQRQGLVRRQSDASDGRVVLVTITGAGLRTLRRRRSGRVLFLADLVSRLDPAEQGTLAAAVPALRAMIGALTELHLSGRVLATDTETKGRMDADE